MAVATRFGSEFQANVATIGDQDTPAIATLENGMFVVMWEDSSGGTTDVKARVYHSDGTPATGEIVVSQAGSGNQRTPVVAGLADGRFVVAFEDDSGGTKDIKARVFNLDGSPDATVNGGSEFTVNTNTPITQQEPAIAALTGGGFAIVWSTDHLDTGDFDIYGRAFDAAGTALGDDFGIDASFSEETQPTVTGLSNGAYAVAWADASEGVRGTVYTGNGIAAPTGQFSITADTDASQPSLAGLPNGTVAATWTDPSLQTIWRKTFPNAGISGPSGSSTITPSSPPAEFDSAVAALPDSSYVVVWVDPSSADGSGFHIRGAVLGAPQPFDQFIVNTQANGDQIQPVVTALPDGRFVVAWVDPGQTIGGGDVSGNSVRVQIFDPRTVAVNLIGSDLGDEFVGTGFDDAMDGGNGNDFLRGAEGNDTLIGNVGDDILDGGAGADLMQGGAGDDTYVVDNPGDQVVEAPGQGTDTVLSSISYTLAANVENLTLIGGSDINGIGNDLDNIVIGNDGNNVLEAREGDDILDGGAGADLMQGGGGDDTYVVDNPGDQVVEAPGQGTDTALSSISYTLSANVENLTLIGGTVNGTGNELDNIVIGNDGNNVLETREGNDILTGGPGADQFVFNTALNKKTNVDTITDFTPGEDLIVLDNAIFKKLKNDGDLKKKYFEIGKKADDGNDYIVYNKKIGDLFYDKNGDKKGGAVLFAQLEDHPKLKADDFLVI